MAILWGSIKLIMKSHECTLPHEWVAFVRLKRANYKFVQLREFGESSVEQTLWANLTEKRNILGYKNENIFA